MTDDSDDQPKESTYENAVSDTARFFRRALDKDDSPGQRLTTFKSIIQTAHMEREIGSE